LQWPLARAADFLSEDENKGCRREQAERTNQQRAGSGDLNRKVDIIEVVAGRPQPMGKGE